MFPFTFRMAATVTRSPAFSKFPESYRFGSSAEEKAHQCHICNRPGEFPSGEMFYSQHPDPVLWPGINRSVWASFM